MRQFITAIILAALLTSFAVPALAQDPPIVTRVGWREKCPSDPDKDAKIAGLAAVLAIIAPRLVEGVVDHAALALQKAAEKKDISSEARAAGYFYSITKDGDLARHASFGCLIVAKGRANPTEVAETALASDPAADIKEVYFRMEAKVERLPGLKYFRLVPINVLASRFEEQRFVGDHERDYSVSVNLLAPGADKPFAAATFGFKALREGQAIASGAPRLAGTQSLPLAYPAELGDANGARKKQERLVAPYVIAMDVITEATVANTDPAPRPSDHKDPAVNAAMKTYCDGIVVANRNIARGHQLFDERCLYELDEAKRVAERTIADAFKSGPSLQWAQKLCPKFAPAVDKEADCVFGVDPSLEGKRFGYFTTQLTLVETRRASEFLKFFAKAVQDSKDDLKTYSRQHLLASERERSEAAKEQADRDVRRGMLLADLEVEKAEDSLAEALSESTPKSSAIRAARIALAKAKIAANDAYRRSGLPTPYPEFD